MPSRFIPQPSARTFSVFELVREVRAGRVRIPEFQRPLRWQWEDVRRLFDSIVKGYPIGNLLLWKRQAPAQRVVLGAIGLDAPAFPEALWVVDGQQRLISLANAVADEGARDPRFSFSYDFEREAFVSSSSSGAFVVPLPVLFDLPRLIQWFAAHPEASEKLVAASELTRALREYVIPAYVVDQQDEAVLRDIFDRMNNYGRRLSRAEVFSALNPTAPEEGDAISFERIIDVVNRQRDFGSIDEDTVLRCILARRGPDVNRDIRVEFTRGRVHDGTTDESAEDAYRLGQDALLRAVAFLQDEAGVPHVSLLPYRYLLVVLVRLFSHFTEPHERNRRLLRRWFWRAAVIGPAAFAGSVTHAARTLAARVVPGDEDNSVQRLLALPVDASIVRPSSRDVRTNTAKGRTVLTALWSLGPRSPSTGEVYTRQDLARELASGNSLNDAFARLLESAPAAYRAAASNRAFLLGEDSPEALVARLEEAALGDERHSGERFCKSHAFSSAAVEALSGAGAEDALRLRQDAIDDVVLAFVERMTETKFEDTPPLDSLNHDDDDDDGDANGDP